MLGAISWSRYFDHARKTTQPPSATPCREEIQMRSDLAVGKRFPDLVLPDHRQQLIKLSELANDFPLILSFYRGYW